MKAFCVDDAGDWDLLVELPGDVPTDWQRFHIGSLIDRRKMESYFAEHGKRHFALTFARANRFSVLDDSDGLAGAVHMALAKPSRLF